MPIIDPSLQCFLVKDIKETEGEDGFSFILKYLQIASRILNSTMTTIESSIQFKKDFLQSISTVNETFGCNFSTAENIGHSFQRNCYKYFYNHINYEDKKSESKKYRGRYKVCNDKFSTRFFHPYVFFSNFHSWSFTDTPIAVLSIDSEKFNVLNDYKKKQQIMQIIKLEIDLVCASGLTLVLCINYAPIINELFIQIIKDNQFSEIHCNIFNDENLNPFLSTMKNNFQNESHFLRGYFYLYCHFVLENTEVRKLMKEFKKKSHTIILKFSQTPDKSLSKIDSIPIKPFLHCKSGFKYEYLRIFLSYVPLFHTETDEESFIPSNTSNLCLSYISPHDFLNMSDKRVQILFDDEENKHHHTIKYVNFEDIHSVRSEFFVNDALLLTKMDAGEIDKINQIKEKIDSKILDKEKFHRNYLYNLLVGNQFEMCLQYVTFAYSHIIRNSIPDFMIHKSQIYAALEACKTCFKVIKDPKEKDTKGVIYQVETGEGKSCIVCLIAAVLAIKKYTVHIASSNIKLSNRDYFNSYEFFKVLGLKPAVLLHKNELPYSDNETSNKEEGNEEEDDLKNEVPMQEQNKNEEDSVFKNNADYYFEINTKESNEYYKKKYPQDLYGDEVFKNPSRMNFLVCGLDNNNKIVKKKIRPNIIFSTFVNFECFYLYLMEMCPGYIQEYYRKCSLLIDEADSILIDEIKNGTIVSREIKSYAKEVLTFIYNQAVKNKSVEETYNKLKDNQMCSDIKLNDVERMYKEIKLVQENDDFKTGRKYILEQVKVRNNHRIRNMIKKTIKDIMNIPDKLAEMIDNKLYSNGDEEDDEDDDEDEELYTGKYQEFKRVIPYDYNHKGILERNKEFSGFIQQFISLKESLEHKDVIFKEISMNYLYISHPIFANLYPKICGFTGTIGTIDDKNIYKDRYHLITKKIPRNKPNLRTTFPTIVCDTITERNQRIVTEVIEFHKKDIPVIVIFQDLEEIKDVQELLFNEEIRCINIFNGKDEYIAPDRIAGIKGAISLGSNVCGRGTDIRNEDLPLHVIVSFYTSNIRVMNQAYGRTARQGQKGTCRCICLKKQYIANKLSINIDKVNDTINEFEYKIKEQEKFIKHYKEKRSWIFDFKIEKQDIPKGYLESLRDSRINVNRIVSYKYKFPICMSVDTFLKIQAQKIFSLFNCPNCKFTWQLFQRYIREMILESWAIIIREVDQIFNIDNDQSKSIFRLETYKKELNNQIKNLHAKLSKYLPERKHFSIISTFMHIYKKVQQKYEKKVLNSFEKIEKAYISFGKTESTLFQLGFKPYSLLNRSGARIDYNSISETNYIEDPELKYQMKMPDNKFSYFSITERIDKIFNSIFQKISSTLGEKVFLKFFLRRTLAGCEFGVCFDLTFINQNEELLKEKHCLVDKNPLLVFTIFIRSTAPLMAGILIFVLVYIAGLTKKIIEWIGTFPEKITGEVIKLGIIAAVNLIVPKTANFFLERIINYLDNVVSEQLKSIDSIISKIINELKNIFLSNEMEKPSDFISEKISKLLGGIIKIPEKLGNILGAIDVSLLMKIGFLLLLCLGTYIKTFKDLKQSIKHAESTAETYYSTFNKESINKKSDSPEECLENILKKEKTDIEYGDIPKLDEIHKNKLITNYDKVSNTYNYKFRTLNLSEYQVKSSDFAKDRDGENEYDYVPDYEFSVHMDSKIRCLKLKYKPDENNDIINFIRLYAANSHPTISHFIGFYTRKSRVRIFVKRQENDFLSDYIYDRIKVHHLNSTSKLIILYGIACVLEFLHNRNIVLRYLNPGKIILDSNFYPYIYDFGFTEVQELSNKNIFFDAPEVIMKCQDSYAPSIAYSYGMIMFHIIMGKPNKSSISAFRLQQEITENEYRPEFPKSADPEWKKLIERCWQQRPEDRPTFTEICDLLESYTFVNSKINISAFNQYKKIVKPFRPLAVKKYKNEKEGEVIRI